MPIQFGNRLESSFVYENNFFITVDEQLRLKVFTGSKSWIMSYYLKQNIENALCETLAI